MDCIRCATGMRKVVKDGVLIDRCPSCKGVWLDDGELEKLEAGKEMPHAVLLHQARKELREEAAKMVSIAGLCPRCQIKKLVQVHRRGVTLDCCPECGGFFFDATELERVMEKEPEGFVAVIVGLFR